MRELLRSLLSSLFRKEILAKGELEVIEMLAKRYHLLLYSFILHYFPDYDYCNDIAQQVLLQLYISLPDLHTQRTLQPWLLRVARNRCLDELRRKRAIPFSLLEMENDEEEMFQPDSMLGLAPSAEELAEQHELQLCLYKAIESLPPTYRPIVWLRYTKLLSFSEIAKTLKLPEATAKTYFQRAKPHLRRMLMAVRE